MQTINFMSEIIASFLDAVIIVYLLNCSMNRDDTYKKFNDWMTVILIFGTSYYLNDLFVLQALLLIFIIAIYSNITLKIKVKYAVTAGILMNVAIAFINLLILLGMSLLTGYTVNELMDTNGMYRIIVLALTKLALLFIGSYIVNRINRLSDFKFYQWIYIFTFFAITFIICILFANMIISEDFNNAKKILLVAVESFLIVLNVFTYFFICYMNRDNNIKVENDLLLLEIENQEDMVKKTTELYEETRELRHDLKHYFVMMGDMLHQGRVNDVIELMEQVSEEKLSKVNVINLKNPVLNAAINEKLALCNRKDIKTELLISGEPPEKMIMDFTILIMNLFDNAIEAEEFVEEKYIELRIQQNGNSFSVEVKNHIEESVMENNQLLQTKKKDLKKHGIGIKSVRRTVEKYNGFMNISEKEGMFIVNCILYDE